MGLSKLPIFQIADKSLMQLQTTWASILNPFVNAVGNFNKLTPTQTLFTLGNGFYTTPANAFYLNVTMVATSGQTVFGSSYLMATSTGLTIPNTSNIKAYYFKSLNYANAIISNPVPNYQYSIASSGYILIREYYQ